jgi:hypothetical protein
MKMNQRADSWKKNLRLIVAKPLIDWGSWLLSHTVRCDTAKNRIVSVFFRTRAAIFVSVV